MKDGRSQQDDPPTMHTEPPRGQGMVMVLFRRSALAMADLIICIVNIGMVLCILLIPCMIFLSLMN